MSHFQNFFEERHEDSKGFKEDSSPATNASTGVTTVDLNMYCLHVLERDYNPRLQCRICHINTMPFKWPELLWNTNLFEKKWTSLNMLALTGDASFLCLIFNIVFNGYMDLYVKL